MNQKNTILPLMLTHLPIMSMVYVLVRGCRSGKWSNCADGSTQLLQSLIDFTGHCDNRSWTW